MMFDWEWIENLSPTMKIVFNTIVFAFLGLLIVISIIDSIKEKKWSKKI